MSDAQRVHAPDVSVVGNGRAGDYAKQSCLSGAISANQTDSFTGVDLKIYLRK